MLRGSHGVGSGQQSAGRRALVRLAVLMLAAGAGNRAQALATADGGDGGAAFDGWDQEPLADAEG